MSNSVDVPIFTGIFSTLDGQTPKGGAFYAKNASVGTGTIKFRPGFTPRRTRPSNFEACLGFQFVKKFSDTSQVAEIISIEKRGGVVKPYSYWNGTTTEITNGGTSVTLENRPHLVTQFYQNAYIIAPGATKTLYRHIIGTNTSFTALQDSSYVAPPSDATISIPSPTYGAYQFSGTDTIAYTGGLSTVTSPTVNGDITVKGATGTGATYDHRTQVEFAASQDWSDRAYIAVEIIKGSCFNLFTLDRKVELKIGGSWVEVETYDYSYPTQYVEQLLLVAYIKGTAGINAVQGVRFRLISEFLDNQASTVIAYTVKPLRLGGQLLEADAPTDRAWSVDPGTGITYAARYKHSSGSPAPTAIAQSTITAEAAKGTTIAQYGANLGGRPQLTVSAANTGTYDQVQFLRLMEDGTTWKELAVKANTGTSVTHIDTKEENELAALTTITLTGVTPVTPTPAFRTTGLKDACRVKNFMCYGFAGAFQNIQYSRVLTEGYPNAAEELYTSAITYDANDLTQPAGYTLSEGGDEPMRILADDDMVWILGNLGVYVQSGDHPVSMSPIRPVPESSPCAGIKACCIFPPSEARSGLAWLDNQGRVWFATAARRYNDVVTSEPVELTKDIRGFIRKYLLDEQRSEYAYNDFSGCILTYSKHDDSLRVILGDRECVYRPQHLQTGKRFWEFHEYTLRHITSSVSTITTDWRSTGVSAGSVAPGDVVWANSPDALVSDNTYATAGSMGYGTARTTETLRFEGFVPDSVIPLGSTITGFDFRVERSKTGDLAVIETTVQPRVSGASSGTNRSTTYTVTTTDTQQVFSPSVLPTVAELNSGAVGLDLKYTQEDWQAAWNDPANYSVVVTNSTSATMTVQVTYIGPGTKPSKAYVNITSSATIEASGGLTVPYICNGTVDNGITSPKTGDFGVEFPGPSTIPTTLTSSATQRYIIALTAGVGSVVLTRSGTATFTTGSGDGFLNTYSGSAALTSPTPATVKVDEVVARVSYQAPIVSDPGATSVQGVASIDKGGFLWVRSSGEVDEVGYDSQSNRPIEGTLRDGGKAAPSGVFELGEYVFPSMARLVYVSTSTGDYRETVGVEATSDRLSSWSTSVNYGTNHRFGVNLHGRKIRVRFTFDESLNSITNANLEFVQLSNQRNK